MHTGDGLAADRVAGARLTRTPVAEGRATEGRGTEGRFAAVRPLLTRGWLAWHLLCLVLAVTMVLLGRWQLMVSNRRHFDLQNFGYALQWWAFTAFGIWLWTRIIRDRRPRTLASRVHAETSVAVAEEPVAYRRYVMPQGSQAAGPSDPQRDAYNEYLAALAERAADGNGGAR